MSTQPITPTPEMFPDWHDPFREPLTIPAGWDLSGINPAPAPAAEEETDTPPEDIQQASR